jgi:hypothetical protein
MKYEVGGTGELSLRYPVYAVLSEDGDSNTNLIVVELEGQDCVPLFRNRELAELYLEQVHNAEGSCPLVLHECRDDTELEHLVQQLPASVAHIIWDATLKPQVIRVTSVNDLLDVIRKGLA